jgi:hypothetical protein
LVRRRLSWSILAAVVAVGLIAGLDALRSSGEASTAAAERERAVTTTKGVTTRKTEPTAELHLYRPPARLKPGRVSTDENAWPLVTFTVPPGWYGYQALNGFALGRGLNAVGGVDLTSGAISVTGVNTTLAQAARRLEQLNGIRATSHVRIGGYSGRKYVAEDGIHNVSLEYIGVPPGSLEPGDLLILLGVEGEALFIVPHTESTTDGGHAEVNRVLMSFEFAG